MAQISTARSDSTRPQWLQGIELDQLPDEAFFLRMRACGNRVRQWEDRYVGLLACAVDRDLPRRRGFHDAHHMAAIQARMSRKKVTEVLRIARAIRGCPGLWRLFTRAEVAWTKLRAITSVARPESDPELCEIVCTQTRKDIELWIRERARKTGLQPSWPGRPGPLPPRQACQHFQHSQHFQHIEHIQHSQPGEPEHACGVASPGTIPTPTPTQAPLPTPTPTPTPAPPPTSGNPTLWADPTAAGTVWLSGGPGGSSPSGCLNPGPESSSQGSSPAPEPQQGVQGNPGRSGGNSSDRFSPGPATSSARDRTPGGSVAPTVGGPDQRISSTSDEARTAVDTGAATPGVPSSDEAVANAGAPSHVEPPPDVSTGEPDSRGNTRTATAGDVVGLLLSMGVDPLAVQKLIVDRAAMSAARHQTPSFVQVLEEAILAHRPSAREVKLPHLLVLTRCPGCRQATVDSAVGPLPVDDADASHLRQSGAAIDLDGELAQRSLSDPDPCDRVPAGVADPSPMQAESSQDMATTTASEQDEPEGAMPVAERRPEVPAKTMRFLMALQGGRCAVRGCPRPLRELHHREPYDRQRGHDVRDLILLCRDHHRLVHTGLVENPADDPALWRIREAPSASHRTPVRRSPTDGRRKAVDRSYRNHLMAATRRDEQLAQTLFVEDELSFDSQ